MNQIIQFSISLIAILALYGIARWLKLGGDARIVDAAQAKQIAFDSHYGFIGVDAVVDRAGFGALIKDAENNHILIKAHGAHFVTRIIEPPIDGRLDHGLLTIVPAESSFGAVTLNLGDQAQYWASGLRHIPQQKAVVNG